MSARARESDRVRIDKTVTEREVEVDEPLIAWDVQIERVALDPPREVDTPPPVRREGDTTVVPVLEERLVVEKRLVVREELRIKRVARSVRDPRRVVLRSERVSVARTTGDDGQGRASNDASRGQTFNVGNAEGVIMDRMLVGVFDTKDQMDAACRDLQESGIPNDRVHIHAGSAQETLGGTGFAKPGGDERGTGFFDRLFGRVPEGERHARLYSEAMRRGGFVVVVEGIDDDRIDEAVQILERDGAYDVDERTAKWRESGWRDEDWEERRGMGEAAAGGGVLTGERAGLATPAPGIANASGDTVNAPGANVAGRSNIEGREQGATIPVVEEQLNVGKREVQRGGVRIFSRTTERPVEENVQLREEHAHVERRPVDRPATEAELGKAFTEKSVELRETVEEPVVAKTARVVEEVDVGKDVKTRTETVRDTVRRTDVEVEQLPEDLPGARVTRPAEGKRPPGRR